MISDAFKAAVEREDSAALRDCLAEGVLLRFEGDKVGELTVMVRPQSGLAALAEAMGRQFARLGIVPPRG